MAIIFSLIFFNAWFQLAHPDVKWMVNISGVLAMSLVLFLEYRDFDKRRSQPGVEKFDIRLGGGKTATWILQIVVVIGVLFFVISQFKTFEKNVSDLAFYICLLPMLIVYFFLQYRFNSIVYINQSELFGYPDIPFLKWSHKLSVEISDAHGGMTIYRSVLGNKIQIEAADVPRLKEKFGEQIRSANSSAGKRIQL